MMAFVRRHWIWITAIVVVLVVIGSLSAPPDDALTTAEATPTATASPPSQLTPSATALPTTATGLGTRADFVVIFEAKGFVGEEAPLNNGQPRWLAQRSSDSAFVEAIGPAESLTQVSLTVPASAENGVLVGEFLNTYAPGSRPFFQEVLDGADATTGADESREIGDRTVHIIVIPASDVALVTTSITP